VLGIASEALADAFEGASPRSSGKCRLNPTRRPVTGLLILEVAVERTVTERCTVWLVVRSSLAAPHVLTDATARRLKVGPKGRKDRLAAFDDHLFVAAFLGSKRRRRDKQHPHESKVHEAHSQHLPKAVANKVARTLGAEVGCRQAGVTRLVVQFESRRARGFRPRVLPGRRRIVYGHAGSPSGEDRVIVKRGHAQR
jgi:hypothetical protein